MPEDRIEQAARALHRQDADALLAKLGEPHVVTEWDGLGASARDAYRKRAVVQINAADALAARMPRVAPRSTRTFAVMEVSPAAFAEIEGKLRDAGYDHAISDDDEGVLLDMGGIALRAEQPAQNAD